MKYRRLFGTLAVPLLSLSFCGLAAAADSRDAGSTSGPEHIYERSCGYCHGHNVGPILLGRDLPPALTRVEMWVPCRLSGPRK